MKCKIKSHHNFSHRDKVSPSCLLWLLQAKHTNREIYEMEWLIFLHNMQLETKMYSPITCTICLYNTFLHCSLTFLHCPNQTPMLCTLSMVLECWDPNVNVAYSDKGWSTPFLPTNFAKNSTRLRIKINPIKFCIPCILPLTHCNF